MRLEGQEEEDEEDFFDDAPERFVLCALHQAKIIRARWKFWSGSVPADVSIRLHRLESILSMNKEDREKTSMVDEGDRLAVIPLEQTPKVDSSQPFLAEMRSYPTIDKHAIEPKHNIILQDPDIRRIVEDKRRVHFWCCH